MFWTFTAFVFGIYIGQEYNIIPSVKLAVLAGIDYLNKYKKENDQQPQQQDESTLFQLIKYFYDMKKVK